MQTYTPAFNIEAQGRVYSLSRQIPFTHSKLEACMSIMAVTQPTVLLEPDTLVTRSLDTSRKPSPYRSSKLPRIPLSPELDQKRRLVAGYQSLLRLEVVAAGNTAGKALTRKAIPFDFRTQLGNADSMELIQLRRSLLASRKCGKCRKSMCGCQSCVPDRLLERMTYRFDRIRSRLSSVSVSIPKKTRSRSVFPGQESAKAQYRILKTEGQGYRIAFKTCAISSLR